jgi:hypothetical protein
MFSGATMQTPRDSVEHVDVQINEAATTKALSFPYISWAAIFAGLAVGIASHMLLTLFGVAAGLSVANSHVADLARVPLMAVIWNAVSMLLSAFIGSYVAARMSGLSRRADGMLHGFVVWGVTTLLFAALATTTLGVIIGSGYNNVADRVQLQNRGIQNQKIEPSTTIPPEAIAKGPDQNSLAANQPTSGNANQSVADEDDEDSSLAAAEDKIDAMAAGSWWLFVGTLLSMIVGIIGGAMGAGATSQRRLPKSYSAAS